MNERVVAIHQPNYLPWIGYFHKIYASDVFIYLDDVEFTSGSWINRNKVKTPDGWMWLTVPTISSTQDIKDTRIATYEDWQTEHRRTFQQNYGGAEYFDETKELLDIVYDRNWQHLVDLNVFFVESLCQRLDIGAEFVYASELNGGKKGADHLACLADEVDAEIYFSGSGAAGYMDEEPFNNNGISVRYQSIEPPEYPQRFEGFESNLSAIDLFLNIGAGRTREILSTL